MPMIEDDDSLTVPPDRRPRQAQPRWRQDFPIDWPQDEYISRREFVKFLLLTSAAFAAGQFYFLAQSLLRQSGDEPAEKEIARLADVPVGGSLLFKYPDDSPARLLVRVDENTVVAYEQQCTHLTCPVVPDVPAGVLHCPCHEGLFDLRTGRPLAGPPRRPLARVRLEVRQERIFAVGVEERTR
jgi:nitrite reductase/ring-hydroxylating ferredoxin subunit